jgi:hypothetical protein
VANQNDQMTRGLIILHLSFYICHLSAGWPLHEELTNVK